MARFFYTVLLYLMLPLLPLRLWWRGRRSPGYRQHWAERFGYAPELNSARPVIWVHCVSVGETQAAIPLIAALRAARPGATFLVTHMTPTGRATALTQLGEDVIRCYLPYDYPWAVRRFLQRVKPTVGILLETEIWFNLLAECHRAQVPLALMNARLSERSARRYARFSTLTATALRSLTLVAAQTEVDAARLEALGARQVAVMGNTKFDLQPAPTIIARGKDWRAGWGGRPVLVAASTRDGEEEPLLDAMAAAGIPGLLTLLVPRHPERWSTVADRLDKRGIRFQRRSAGVGLSAEVAVLLGDSMGEMYAYYAAADVAVIGGSWQPLGGQNLIEAASVGCPTVVGPHMFNFAEATRLACAAGAAIQVQGSAELPKVLAGLFSDVQRRTAMAQAAQQFTQHHRGAANRAVALLAPWLPAGGGH